MKQRLLIALLAIGLTALGVFLPYRAAYFAILSAAMSAVSGYLSIRNREEPPRIAQGDSTLVTAYRRVIAKDALLAILLIQTALIAQAVSTLLGLPAVLVPRG